MSSIQITGDYNLFRHIAGNRKLNKAHIRALVDTLQVKPYLSQYNPILVNDKFQIVDGQHRFAALKQLNLPIYYIQGKDLTLEDVQDLNAASKNWSPVDFARSYADLGNKNYELYLEFKKEYGLNHDVLLQYLSIEKPITSYLFKKGELKVIQPSLSHELARCLIDMGQFYDGFKRRSFAIAFKQMWSNKNYDHQHMLERMGRYGNELQDYALPLDYVRALEQIYNKYVPIEKQVRFF